MSDRVYRVTRNPEMMGGLVAASEHMIVKHDGGPFASSRLTFVAGLIAALTSPFAARSGLQPTPSDFEMEQIIVYLPGGMAVAIHILSDDEETRSFVGALVRALTTVDDSKAIDPFSIDTDRSSAYTMSSNRRN